LHPTRLPSHLEFLTEVTIIVTTNLSFLNVIIKIIR
jgi:hypothetical protein